MSTLSEMSIAAIDREWSTADRWAGIERSYDGADVVRLRGSVRVEQTLARRGAERLWRLLRTDDHVSAAAAMTGAQAVEMVKAGMKAIHVPGWQVAADANNALRRADQIEWAESSTIGDGETSRDWMVPIVADAEAGFGGLLNAYELTTSMIEAGAAGVHFEDQPSSPTGQHIGALTAARLAADVAGVPTIIIARTNVQLGIDAAVARGLAYAPYADMIWCETAAPDLWEARIIAERIKAVYPDKLLAYNCSPSLNWPKHLGYALQFVTPAEPQAYNATRHQREVGARFFDDITSTLSGGLASTLA